MALNLMTPSIMTLSIMTLSIMTLSIMTVSIMTVSIMTLSKMTHDITILRITRLGTMTQRLRTNIKMINCDNQHKFILYQVSVYCYSVTELIVIILTVVAPFWANSIGKLLALVAYIRLELY